MGLFWQGVFIISMCGCVFCLGGIYGAGLLARKIREAALQPKEGEG